MAPTWPPRYGLVARARHAAARATLRRDGLREIASTSELGQRLRNPSAIVCLGNGPSSESERIPADCDCLFRANWVWRHRGLLTEPDVVFTADPDLPPPGSHAIIGFPTVADATRILRRQRRARRAPAAWFAVPSMAPAIASIPRDAFPTNGALMIAVAAALDPARLVISGIDLYDHPQGKYPGENSEPNEYAGIHHPQVEVDFIRWALAGYRRELIVLSDNLRAALMLDA